MVKNIGIFAHVDAGKTTIAENMLYLGGCIRNLGRVDKGTAKTDNMEIERQKGISIRSASASFQWKEVTINLIDTPGHADFYAEVERSICLLDGAILVISAVEGVQAQTKIIWMALEEHNIPTIIFVNKIDRIGVDIPSIYKNLSMELTDKILSMQYVNDDEMKIVNYLNADGARMITFYENCALLDEEWLNEYCENNFINKEHILKVLCDRVMKRMIFPVYYGSALKNLGVETLLDAIVEMVPEFQASEQNPFSAITYKVENDKLRGRIVYIRVFNGKIGELELVRNLSLNSYEKVIRLYKVEGIKLVQVSSLKSGEIGAIAGITAKIGNVLGELDENIQPCLKAKPLLTFKIEPTDYTTDDTLLGALQQLQEEEPLLNVVWVDAKKEINIQMMGTIQMEVVSELLKERYGIHVKFDKPLVLYRETLEKLTKCNIQKDEYTELGLSIEPIKRGKGIQFESEISTDFIFKKYQNEVFDTLEDALRHGPMGYEVVDVLVKIISGKSTPVATLPSDFRNMTYTATDRALKNGKTKLLEPYLKFTLCIPRECSKSVYSELVAVRARFQNTRNEYDNMYFSGICPVATTIDFATKIASLTGGRGVYMASFNEYL